MKKLILLIGIIFVLVASIGNVTSAAPNNSQCLSFKVTYNASNYGKIQVGCQGLNSGTCVGGIIDIRPGNTKTLNNCACPYNTKLSPTVFKGWADGCLYVAKELKIIKRTDSNNRPGIGLKTPINSSCEINTNKFTQISSGFYKTAENVCGLNKTEIPIPIQITCPGPSVTVTNTNTPTPTTPVITNTNTPTPTTAICPVPAKVTGIRIKCPECAPQTTPTAGPSPTSAPTSTPTITPTVTATPTPTKAPTATPEQPVGGTT